jgi:hypothetical protein
MQQQIPPLLDVVDHYRRNGVLATVDGRLPIEAVGEAVIAALDGDAGAAG